MVDSINFAAQAIMYGVGAGVVVGTFISILLLGVWKN